MNGPVCGKCGIEMTPENAKLRPELFLHDECLPVEFRQHRFSIPVKMHQDQCEVELSAANEYIKKLRSAIEAHRSQKADDRCVEDDDRLYETLGDGIKCDRRVGSKSEMLKNCERFINQRCENGGPWKSYAEIESQLAAVDTLKYMIDDLAKAYGIDPCENRIELLMAIGCKMQFLWDLSRMSGKKISAMEADVRKLRAFIVKYEEDLVDICRNEVCMPDILGAITTVHMKIDSLPAIGSVK